MSGSINNQENENHIISALVLGFFHSLTFVGSLYLFDSQAHHRNHPITVQKRFKASYFAAVITLAFDYIIFQIYNPNHQKNSFLREIGVIVSLSKLIKSIIFVILLNSTLFMGSIYMEFAYYGEEGDPNLKLLKELKTWKKIAYFLFIFPFQSPSEPENLKNEDEAILLLSRNLFMGPMLEEFTYRAGLVSLFKQICHIRRPLPLYSLSSFFFGVSHLHHAINLISHENKSLKIALLQAGFQVAYTAVFGLYSTFVFDLLGGNVWAVCLLHAICNFLGFPDFAEAARLRVPLVLHVVGVVMFFTFAFWNRSSNWILKLFC